jgi:hypothetical protein
MDLDANLIFVFVAMVTSQLFARTLYGSSRNQFEHVVYGSFERVYVIYEQTGRTS